MRGASRALLRPAGVIDDTLPPALSNDRAPGGRDGAGRLPTIRSPLRARREDVPLLVDHFISRYRRAAGFTVSPAAMEALMAFDWPGNVRQLERIIERALALAAGPTMTLADLPAEDGA